MGLVDYASSDEDETNSDKHVNKRRRVREASPSRQGLPKLPNEFQDLYAVAPRLSTQDDTALHQGRKRAVPHVEGNWPTHIYLEWMPSQEYICTLQDVVAFASKEASCKVHSLLLSDVGTPLPLHISLSAPLILRTEERDEFYESLKEAIHSSPNLQRSYNSRIRKHTLGLRLDGLKWAANQDRNRWFLATGIEKPGANELNSLLMGCNELAASRSQPLLYAEPSSSSGARQLSSDSNTKEVDIDFSRHFHFSIAWTLSKPTRGDHATRLLRLPSTLEDRLRQVKIEMDGVKLKVGSEIKNIHFAES